MNETKEMIRPLFVEFAKIDGVLQPIHMVALMKCQYGSHEPFDSIEDYAIYHSKAYGELIIENEGSGGKLPYKYSLSPYTDKRRSVIWWADLDVKVANPHKAKNRRLARIPEHCMWLCDRKEWDSCGDNQKEMARTEGETICCKVCADDLPRYSPCDHLFWDGWIGAFSGCGCYEAVYHEWGKEPLFALLSCLGPVRAKRLRNALAAHDYNICELLDEAWSSRGFIHDECLSCEEYAESGYEWLRSLESGKTHEGDDQVVKWIDEWFEEAPMVLK